MEPLKNSYRFFRNTDCEFFPCHGGMDQGKFNCLFCYCPLYLMGEDCGGNFRYVEGSTGRVKDCSACALPHHPADYDRILTRLFNK